MTPNGDGYFFSATKDTITVLKGADTLGRFPASATVIVDGESIVISSDGVKQRYPVAGFDTIYAVDDVISSELILKSCNWIIMILEDLYDITITSTGKEVFLNSPAVKSVIDSDLKMYWGTLRSNQSDNTCKLTVKIGASEIDTLTFLSSLTTGYPEPVLYENVHFNNTTSLQAFDNGMISLLGLEFVYTINV